MNVIYVNANCQLTSFGNYFPSLEDNKGISTDLMNVNYVNANRQVTSFGNYFPSLEDNKGISTYLKVTGAKGPGWFR
jgi:hypothetical protein